MKKVIITILGLLLLSCSLEQKNNSNNYSRKQEDSRASSGITEDFLEGSWLVYMYDVDKSDSDWYKKSTKRVYGDGTNEAHRIIFENYNNYWPSSHEGYISNKKHFYNGSDYYESDWIEPYVFLPRTGKDNWSITSLDGLAYRISNKCITFFHPDNWFYNHKCTFTITKYSDDKIKLDNYTRETPYYDYEINNKDKRFATQKLELFLYRDTADGLNGDTIVTPVFKDSNLKNIIYRKIKERPITIKHLNSILELDLSGENISNLTGLKYLKNLEKLNLSNNNITDISELSSLRSLKELDLSFNKIKDLSPLMEVYDEYYPASSQRTDNNTGDYVNKFSFPNLTYLNVNNNNMEIYDYPIGKQANINWNGVLYNYQFKHLTHDLNEAQIDYEVGNNYATVNFEDPVLEKIIRRIILKTDPSAPIYKHDLVHIDNLNFDSNTVKLTDLEGLQYCPNLQVLRIDNQEGITSLAPLYSQDSMLDKLEKIYATNCNISGFYVEHGKYKALNSLKTLVVESNKLRFSDSNFDWCPNLEYINWNNNAFKTIQSQIPIGFFDNLTSLKHISLARNKINRLDPGLFCKLAELKKVYLYDNNLTQVPDSLLSNNGKIMIINFGQNPLDNIDFLLKNSSSNYSSCNKIVLDGSLPRINPEDLEKLKDTVKPTCEIIQ